MATLRNELPHAKLVVMPLDLADLASVRRFAETLASRYSQLDLLCNNAGVMALPERQTHDGFEMQVGTNHFGHFALTGLLLPLLARSPSARIVTVSSLMHLIGSIRFDDIHRRQHYAKWSAYAQSKLANLMFALELARRLPAHATTRHIISAAAHPGYAATELQMAGPKMANSSTDKLAMAISNVLLAQPLCRDCA